METTAISHYSEPGNPYPGLIIRRNVMLPAADPVRPLNEDSLVLLNVTELQMIQSLQSKLIQAEIQAKKDKQQIKTLKQNIIFMRSGMKKLSALFTGVKQFRTVKELSKLRPNQYCTLNLKNHVLKIMSDSASKF